MGIGDIVQRWRVRRSLRKFVSPAVIKLIEEGPGPHPPKIGPPERKHFQFVVTYVDDRELDHVSATLGSVIATLYKHKAFLTTAMPPLVVATLGWMYAEDSPVARKVLVDELLAENHSAIRIAHGECEGLVGNFGGETRFCFGALIPNYSQLVTRLLDTPFGEAVEIR